MSSIPGLSVKNWQEIDHLGEFRYHSARANAHVSTIRGSNYAMYLPLLWLDKSITYEMIVDIEVHLLYYLYVSYTVE